MKNTYILLLLLVANSFADSSVAIQDAMSSYRDKLSQSPSTPQGVAKVPYKTTSKVSLYDECFDDASLKYNIPSNLLRSIARVESKMKPDAINFNKNGSFDVGIMQINSTWFPRLARVGIQRGELLDGCKNIQVGAWILSQNVKRYGLTAEAIGRYNSPNPYYKARYVRLVLAEYNRTKKQQLSLASN